jgi:broad specificity phosphatase PhoE
MKTVYFVRHGETEGNTGKVFQGENTPLNEKGREQGQIIAERCKRLPIDIMITSSTARARETASIISNAIGKKAEASDLFIERLRPRGIEGRLRTDTEATAVNEAWNRSIFENGPRVSDGENFMDIKDRVGKALEFLEQIEQENVLVVTHGFFLRSLLARIIFGSKLTVEQLTSVIRRFRTNNTGLTMFQYGLSPEPDYHPLESEWIVRIWNDHAHLG